MTEAAPVLVAPASALSPAPHAAQVVQHLAHELRQPLSAIESIAYYLRMTLPQESKARQQLDRLDQMVELAEWMLTDAIHYLDAASATPQLLDLHEVLSAHLASREVDETCRRCVEIEPRRALVRMDVAQARHLVRSLLAVGQKMAQPAAMLHVRAWVEDSEALVQLSLPEVHYDASQLRSLFEPFAPHQPAALGLALASAVRIVERCGGRVEAQSAAGCGTWLLVRLPLVE